MFFFFKQKTAYEMRISDWSSDVCSSDLAGRCHSYAVIAPLARDDFLFVGMAQRIVVVPHQLDDRVVGFRARIGKKNFGHAAAGVAHQEIGRASCRERVWQ